jgi:Tfp pilus assembly protein FimT
VFPKKPPCGGKNVKVFEMPTTNIRYPIENISAWSLLEFIVLLLIFSIIFSFSSPRISGTLDHYRLKNFTQKVEAEIEHAITISQILNEPIVVIFSNEQKRIETTPLNRKLSSQSTT